MNDLGTLPDWAGLAPALALVGTALLLFLYDMIEPDSQNNLLLAGIAGIGSLTALGFAGWFLLAGTGQPDRGGAIELFDGQLVVDAMALFFMAIFASVTLLVVVASYDYLAGRANQAAYYSLVMLAATGMAVMATADSFVTAFISLELASLPSYALVASLKQNQGSVEAGLKYFLVGALSSAIFVYGISLIYVETGVLQFGEVATALASGELSGVVGLGILFIIGGFAFKTASVPFHFWAPEAYEGAPAPISAFLSSASKAAGFVLAFRVFLTALPRGSVEGTLDWVIAFQVLAIVTMTVANFAALRQEKVKRMLAYSSVGHAGFVLIALGALTSEANRSFVLGSGMAHLLVYGFMNTGAFLVIALTEHWGIGREIEDFNGLATQAPFACAALTVFLFSLAGLPLGGGFLSKFYLLLAAIDGEVALLAIALVVNSAVSVFYYTRVVKAMWVEEPADDLAIEGYPSGLYVAITFAVVLTVLLLPGFGFVLEFTSTAAETVVPG